MLWAMYNLSEVVYCNIVYVLANLELSVQYVQTCNQQWNLQLES